MSPPLISVIIPTYNQERYLPAAVESVFNQTYPNFEVIIIDDGSTDGTPKLPFEDERVSYYRQENQGVSRARNAGIERAKGTSICLLDADDLMAADRLEQQLSLTGPDVLYTAVEVIDEVGIKINTIRQKRIEPQNFLAEMFFRNQITTASTVMAKRKCFLKEPFHEKFHHAEDYEWALRAAHHFTFEYLDRPLTYYRRHTANVSENLKAHRESELKILRGYGSSHIFSVIDKTTFAEEEKILFKGKMLVVMEEYDHAIVLLKNLDLPLASFYLGNAYFRLNQLQRAVEAYEKSAPSNPACLNNLGLCYSLLGEMKKGQDCFKRALKLKPGYLDPKKNLEGPTPSSFTLRELREDLLLYR